MKNAKNRKGIGFFKEKLSISEMNYIRGGDQLPGGTVPKGGS